MEPTNTEPEMKEPEAEGESAETQMETSVFGYIFNEIISSPMNMLLLLAIVYLMYKIFKGRRDAARERETPPTPLPKLKKRDMSLQELRQFDGSDPSGRILVAVNGKVFDVTRGKRFYGPGKPPPH